MSDTIDRQAAIDAIQKDRETGWEDSENDVAYRNACDDGYAYAMQIISELPTVDAVEVVRCNECRYWDSDGEHTYGYCMAMKHGYFSRNWEISIRRKYRDDWYCADGERRTDETD